MKEAVKRHERYNQNSKVEDKDEQEVSNIHGVERHGGLHPEVGHPSEVK